ncbi:IS21-like element helper ATPase IstB [Persicobacter psychrovividus]|uniref:ATP-binding protein n=1 Tax=Persicobacter psychrovividus TaxID=387638 RepID=A0ABN6L7B8_9BACT|nr:ATP-binding protein [Persicobacter psychrovividus]BDD02097.1 ATP-binding protein [Persicobacter psychrovividus]
MNSQTIEKLHKLRLFGMAELHQQQLNNTNKQSLTVDEYLALLVDHEYDQQQNRRVGRLLKQARLRQNANLNSVNYHANRNLDKNTFSRLGTLDFIDKKENIILTGPSGVGKSYLAQALGHQACMMQKKVRYSPFAKLIDQLHLSKIDGTYQKELSKINLSKLLILDDFGLHSFNKNSREIMMDLIEERHNFSSTIIASQLPVSAWHKMIGEGTIADAILDRIVHSSHRIELKGDSLRKGKIEHL